MLAPCFPREQAQLVKGFPLLFSQGASPTGTKANWLMFPPHGFSGHSLPRLIISPLLPVQGTHKPANSLISTPPPNPLPPETDSQRVHLHPCFSRHPPPLVRFSPLLARPRRPQARQTASSSPHGAHSQPSTFSPCFSRYPLPRVFRLLPAAGHAFSPLFARIYSHWLVFSPLLPVQGAYKPANPITFPRQAHCQPSTFPPASPGIHTHWFVFSRCCPSKAPTSPPQQLDLPPPYHQRLTPKGHLHPLLLQASTPTGSSSPRCCPSKAPTSPPTASPSPDRLTANRPPSPPASPGIYSHWLVFHPLLPVQGPTSPPTVSFSPTGSLPTAPPLPCFSRHPLPLVVSPRSCTPSPRCCPCKAPTSPPTAYLPPLPPETDSQGPLPPASPGIHSHGLVFSPLLPVQGAYKPANSIPSPDGSPPTVHLLPLLLRAHPLPLGSGSPAAARPRRPQARQQLHLPPTGSPPNPPPSPPASPGIHSPLVRLLPAACIPFSRCCPSKAPHARQTLQRNPQAASTTHPAPTAITQPMPVHCTQNTHHQHSLSHTFTTHALLLYSPGRPMRPFPRPFQIGLPYAFIKKPAYTYKAIAAPADMATIINPFTFWSWKSSPFSMVNDPDTPAQPSRIKASRRDAGPSSCSDRAAEEDPRPRPKLATPKRRRRRPDGEDLDTSGECPLTHSMPPPSPLPPHPETKPGDDSPPAVCTPPGGAPCFELPAAEWDKIATRELLCYVRNPDQNQVVCKSFSTTFPTNMLCEIGEGRDSDLEAFSHNPADGSFAPLAPQPKHIHQMSEPAVPLWVNNPTLGEFCFTMIGRADIEGSKSDVAMNAGRHKASYPVSTGRNHIASTPPWPSRCFVLIKQSDSPGPHQFLSQLLGASRGPDCPGTSPERAPQLGRFREKGPGARPESPPPRRSGASLPAAARASPASPPADRPQPLEPIFIPKLQI
ncbi:hypothetical protein CRENBAI_005582 [Crenichthys baileyi]|uniref:Uncharacterized protein n=1 Tax=Crenichthys baileyi TaxID=28760 RepID=A0AAV9SGG4_9TELE